MLVLFIYLVLNTVLYCTVKKLKPGSISAGYIYKCNLRDFMQRN